MPNNSYSYSEASRTLNHRAALFLSYLLSSLLLASLRLNVRVTGTYQHLICCYLWLLHFLSPWLSVFIDFFWLLWFAWLLPRNLSFGHFWSVRVLLSAPQATACRCADCDLGKVAWTKGVSGGRNPEWAPLLSHSLACIPFSFLSLCSSHYSLIPILLKGL